MSRTNCPACSAPLSLLSIVSAPTPFHLACRSCKARLRVRGLVEPLGLGLAVILGIVIGVRVGLYGLAAEALPSLALLVAYELITVAWIIAFGKLELRS